MNKKELDVFIEHLIQVWKPHHPSAWKFRSSGGPGDPAIDFDFPISGYIELDDRLKIVFTWARFTLQYLDEQGLPAASLWIHTRIGDLRPKSEPQIKVLSETDAQFVDADGHIKSKWLLIFRRNCWLSGVQIECSAEERAEWVKGYSYRQIDEWNSVLLGDERHLRV